MKNGVTVMVLVVERCDVLTVTERCSRAVMPVKVAVTERDDLAGTVT